MSEETQEWGKAVLRPRNEGEDLKVAQAVLKRRDRNIDFQAERQKRIRTMVREKQARPDAGVASAEKILAKARARIESNHRVKRWNKKLIKQPKVMAPPKVILAVRNGYTNECVTLSKHLQKLRLARHNAAVFLPNTKETLDALSVVSHLVFFGYPNKNTVSNLMQKQAMIKDPKDRTVKFALSDNAIVEEHMADIGMLCVEDIVAEIIKCGKNFDKVMNKIRTFTLNDTRTAEKMVADKQCVAGNLKYKVNEVVNKLIGLQ